MLSDLAKEVGVSISTASRALRNLPGVNPDVRARVERAAKRSNYVPNQHARSLSMGQTNLVALATPPIAEMTPQEEALGRLETLARADGMKLVRVNYERTEIPSLLNSALEQHWRGMLLFPHAPDEEINSLVGQLKEFGIPVVAFNGSQPSEADVVKLDASYGMRLLVDHAHEQGFQRICILGYEGEMNDLPHSLKFHSIERALRHWGMELVAKVGYTERPSHGFPLYETAYEAFDRALAEGLKVDLVMGANDVIALAAMNCLFNRGLRVPDDVAVCGYDDTDHARFARPPLTSMRAPIREMMELCWGMLRGRLAGDIGVPRAVTLLPELVVRASTGAKRRTPNHASAPISNPATS